MRDHVPTSAGTVVVVVGAVVVGAFVVEAATFPRPPPQPARARARAASGAQTIRPGFNSSACLHRVGSARPPQSSQIASLYIPQRNPHIEQSHKNLRHPPCRVWAQPRQLGTQFRIATSQADTYSSGW